MKNVLAFDLGASSGRAVAAAFDGKKLSLEEIHRFSNDPVMVGKTFYWDILRLLHEIKTGISKANLTGTKFDSLGIDAWGVDFGMLDKNDFVILTVRGRAKDSEGVGVAWLLDRFLEIGVKEAFNLDGGGTSCLVFMGEMLDKSAKSAREINSMIRFGTSPLVGTK